MSEGRYHGAPLHDNEGRKLALACCLVCAVTAWGICFADIVQVYSRVRS